MNNLTQHLTGQASLNISRFFLESEPCLRFEKKAEKTESGAVLFTVKEKKSESEFCFLIKENVAFPYLGEKLLVIPFSYRSKSREVSPVALDNIGITAVKNQESFNKLEALLQDFAEKLYI